LDHDALQLRPIVGVVVDRDGDAGSPAKVADLARVLGGGEVELPVDENVADGDQMGHASRVRCRDAAHAFPFDELRERFLEAQEGPGGSLHTRSRLAIPEDTDAEALRGPASGDGGSSSRRKLRHGTMNGPRMASCADGWAPRNFT